jgi:hypothetical protein
MGSFQDGYVGQGLFGTLPYHQQHGNHGLFSLHDTVQVPVNEKFPHQSLLDTK